MLFATPASPILGVAWGFFGMSLFSWVFGVYILNMDKRYTLFTRKPYMCKPKFNQRFNNWHGTNLWYFQKEIKVYISHRFHVIHHYTYIFPKFCRDYPFHIDIVFNRQARTDYLTLHPLINYLKFKRKFVKSINKRLDSLPNTIRDLSLLNVQFPDDQYGFIPPDNNFNELIERNICVRDLGMIAQISVIALFTNRVLLS